MNTQTTLTTSDAHIVHEADLIDPVERGGRLRSYCPVHGGDHRRSLSIALEGELAGWGYCHNASCNAKVFVPELNPDAWERMERAAVAGHHPKRTLRAADLLRPIAPRATTPAKQELWKQEEVRILTNWTQRMQERLHDAHPRAYLAERRIPLDIALDCGVGYLPADVPVEWREVERNGKTQRMLMIVGTMLSAKWRDRLIFPLGSPDGTGYAGRSLHDWQPGMDELAHKALLDALPNGPNRWEKTNPTGWYGYDVLGEAPIAVLVEGTFDRLALIAAGVPDNQVVALAGVAANTDWMNQKRGLRGVILATDGDAGGREAMRRLAREMYLAGMHVQTCLPPDDGTGKDWSARWRTAEWDGVAPIFDALDELMATISADE